MSWPDLQAAAVNTADNRMESKKKNNCTPVRAVMRLVVCRGRAHNSVQ